MPNQIKVPEGPRFEQRESFRVAGLALECTPATTTKIPELWSRFGARIGTIPHQVDRISYGVCIPKNLESDEFTYVAAVEVSQFDALPDDLTCVDIPQSYYAVFTHQGSVGTIAQSMDYVFGQWLPNSTYEPTGTPDFELYDERFNPMTGSGAFDIYVPLVRE